MKVLRPYRCHKHGAAPYYDGVQKGGRAFRRCKICWAETRKKSDARPERVAYLKNYNAKYQTANRDVLVTKQREYAKALKATVIAAYGGKCDCCGEREIDFLTVDHVNGGGRKHTKTLGARLYTWLRDHGFPRDEFRILCFNCNCGRSVNKGTCPHTKRTAESIRLAFIGRRKSA